MSRAAAGAFAALVVLGAVAALGVSAAAAGAPDGAAPPADAAPAVQVDADRVEFRVTVHANGSARWRFLYVRTLDNESERDQFRSFAEEFETNETAAYRDFVRQAEGLTAAGTNATGRPMAAEAFHRSAAVGGDCVPTDACGTVEMSFRWTAFARQDGERLVVDDVFEGGLYVGADQSLVFEHGPSLRFADAAPDTYRASGANLSDSESITWQGPARFTDRRPRVTFAPAAAPPVSPNGSATPTVLGDGPGDTPTDPAGGGVPMLLVGGVTVMLVGAALAFASREHLLAAVRGEDDDGGAGATAAPETPEPAVAEEELLTDEDRVVGLLEENGGRMKQVDIVEETGWSKSKVSMLLSDMEDDGEISKLRVGRENIVSLAGHEPDAAGSPHED
jgi:hypothetical protein